MSLVEIMPAGRWGVAVSGGADSVALLHAAALAGVAARVIHFDHDTRAGASAEDAAFVVALAGRLGVECATRRWAGGVRGQAGYRAARLAWFAEAAAGLDGVLLGHHADDQAETVLLRLVRGAGLAGLAGMDADRVVGGVRIVRPMLGVRRATVQAWLTARGGEWREDASNASPAYGRNRVRAWLARWDVTGELLAVGKAAAAYRDWLDAHAPRLGERFRVGEIGGDGPLERRAAARWLAGRGCRRATCRRPRRGG